MIDRKELKKNAKRVLRKTYFMALLMSFVLCLSGAISYNSRSSSSNAGRGDMPAMTFPTNAYGLPSINYRMDDLLTSMGYTNSILNEIIGRLTLGAFLGAILGIVLIGVAVSLLFRLLLGYPLEIGARGYFLDTAQGKESGFGRLKYGFTCGHYKNIIVTMFFRGLYITLWGLLLIVPGVIKLLSYSMVPYLLADNPALNRYRTLELSREMTNGYKGRIAVLWLSFFGWYFLGALLFTVGQVLVWPYIEATFAQLYLKLRENAVNCGITSWDELGLDEYEVEVIDL